MLRRARIALELALLPGIIGFSGIFQVTAGAARIVCFVFVAVAVISLLFSLFEEADSPAVPEPARAPVPLAETGVPNLGSSPLVPAAVGPA